MNNASAAKKMQLEYQKHRQEKIAKAMTDAKKEGSPWPRQVSTGAFADFQIVPNE